MDILSFAIGYKKGRGSGGGGGSSDERVKYVTFMNGDTELLKYPVIEGDDCRNPLTSGLIGTPTKEQSVSTIYTYSGWSLTNGGAASSSSSALKNVTDDRTVYAAYSETTRTYTVRFYDGETLLDTQTISYGVTPSYTVGQKDGYKFAGWQPSVVAVEGDADYYAQWIESVEFASTSWDDIAAASENGTAAQLWSVGDTKTFALTDEDGTTSDITVRIIGFNHDDLSDGSGKAGITLETVGIGLADTDMRTDSNENAGGWAAMPLRSHLNDTVITYLPSELREHIKEVVKVSDIGGTSTETTTTNDKLWVLSFTESNVVKANSYSLPESSIHPYPHGSVYEYYETGFNYADDKKVGAATFSVEFFTRSCSADNAYMWISRQGKTGLGDRLPTKGGNVKGDVAFAFCI